MNYVFRLYIVFQIENKTNAKLCSRKFAFSQYPILHSFKNSAEFQFNLDHLESKFMCLMNDIIYLFKLPAIIWQSISGHSKWPIYYVVFCRQYRNLWFGSDVSHNS